MYLWIAVVGARPVNTHMYTWPGQHVSVGYYVQGHRFRDLGRTYARMGIWE